METRAGMNTTTHTTITQARSNPVPIPLPNSQRTPLQSSAAHNSSHHSTPLSAFNLNQHLLDALEADEAGDSSSDEDPDEDEKKSKITDVKESLHTHSPDRPKTTVLNFLSSSPLKVTISPPLHLSRGNRTPPILNLSPLPSPKHFQGPRSRSLSPRPTAASHHERMHETEDHTGNTILNILGGSPGVTFTISPQPSSFNSSHRSPVITFSPLHSPASRARNSHLTLNNDPRPQDNLALDEQKKQAIQIILPETDPLLQWAIDWQEVSVSPSQAHNASAETAPLLSQPSTKHETQIQITELTRQTSINADLEAEKRCKELLKDIAYHLLLIALVSPNAMNAFCEPSGVKPANISAEWWNGLSTEIQFLSIANAFFSLGVNVFVQRDYIPQALKELRESFGKCFSSLRDFLGNSLTLVSSSAAAFSFAAMSYEAFKWLGEGASAVPGLASLGTSFTTRYPSVKKGALKTRLLFNKDLRFQKEIADKLRHLKSDYVKELNRLIRTNNYKLQGKDIALLLESLGSELEGIPIDELLSKKTNKEFIREYVTFIVEVSFATLIASTAFETFTQKGFDGANAIAHLLGHSLEHLDRTEKFSIGATGGLVSAILYYIAALNFIPTISYVASELFKDLFHATQQLATHPINTIKGTIEDPQRFFRFLKLTLGVIAVWRSSGAMITVGSGVSSNQKGIFWPLFQLWETYAKVFPTLNGLGGIAINMTATINQILKKEREDKRKKPQLEDIAHFLEEMLLPPTVELSHDGGPHKVDTLPQLKTFSLFKAAPLTNSAASQAATNHNAEEAKAHSEPPLMEDPDFDERPVRPSPCTRLLQFCTLFKSTPAARPVTDMEMTSLKPREVTSEDEDNEDLPLLESPDLENPRRGTRPTRTYDAAPVKKFCAIM